MLGFQSCPSFPIFLLRDPEAASRKELATPTFWVKNLVRGDGFLEGWPRLRLPQLRSYLPHPAYSIHLSEASSLQNLQKISSTLSDGYTLSA